MLSSSRTVPSRAAATGRDRPRAAAGRRQRFEQAHRVRLHQREVVHAEARGAEIRCNTGGHVCVLPMEGRPLHGMTFGVVGTVAPLVDLRGEEGRSPARMRPAPITEAGRQRQ